MTARYETIAVTGAAGWLGGRILQLLLAGGDGAPGFDRICAFIRPGERVPAEAAVDPRVSIVEGDVRSPGDVRRFVERAGAGALIHTAGVIHPRRVAEFYAINAGGTRNLFEACETGGGPKRCILVSSNSPIGVSRTKAIFDETTPYDPYMNYGRSKMEMEEIAAEFNARGALDVTILRPPWFYGLNQPPRQTEFFRMIRDGRMPQVGDGENVRSMAYLDNIFDGIALSLAVPAASRETFWIADARPYTMNEIVETIENLLEREFDTPCAHKRLKLPDAAGEVATIADGLIQRAGLYQQKIHVLSEMNKSIACSIEKARRVLGYAPKVDLQEGMRRSLRWLYEHRGGIDA
jgi:nucleoside-diphosphate-sugar epimerase